jgi:hypothetical protein
MWWIDSFRPSSQQCTAVHPWSSANQLPPNNLLECATVVGFFDSPVIHMILHDLIFSQQAKKQVLSKFYSLTACDGLTHFGPHLNNAWLFTLDHQRKWILLRSPPVILMLRFDLLLIASKFRFVSGCIPSASFCPEISKELSMPLFSLALS